MHGLLAAREVHLGLKPGSIGTVALIESPAAIFQLMSIAKTSRVIGLALGSEDFSVATGAPPSSTLLTLPAQMICLTAAACGIMALAVPHSIAAFREIEGWATGVETARAIGATGGLCIHPSQVKVLNTAFSPTAAEISWAEAVVEAWSTAKASGQGVCKIDGQMIDRPVVQRAQTLLSRRLATEMAGAK
jgi:citrate lyase subunit beta/citryl-CoA lyase